MTKYWWLIVVVVFIVQGIAGAMREKKAKEERMQKAAEHRSRQGSQPAGHAERESAALAAPQQQRTTAATPAASRQDRLEELRRRRQAQLDELRQRTAARKAGSRAGPGRGSVVRSGQTAARPAAPQRPAPPARAGKGPGGLRTSPVASRPKTATPPPVPTVAPRSVDQQREEERHAHQLIKPAPSSAPAMPRASQSTDRLQGITARDLSAQELRRIVILREIFDPPIALREDGDNSNRF